MPSDVGVTGVFVSSVVTKKTGIIVTTALLSVLPLSSVVERDMPPGRIKEYADYIRSETSPFRQEVNRIYSEAESCFHDGRWDFSKLLELQKEYFEMIRGPFHEYAFSKEGVPNSVMEIMPQIESAAKEKRVNHYLLSGVVCKESLGYKYAINVVYSGRGKDRRIKSVALGYGQVNIKANKVTPEQYRDIFKASTNLSLSAGIIHEYIRTQSDLNSAITAYWQGPNVRHTNRERQRRYVNDVRKYWKLVRKSESETVAMDQ